MVTLSPLIGKLEREHKQLHELNMAFIALEAQAGGYADELGLAKDDIERSRRTLSDLVIHLRSELDDESPHIDFLPFVNRMRNGAKPVAAWQEDLDALATQLRQKGHVEEETLSDLDRVLSLLDAEFGQDIHRLYYRY